MRIKKGLTFMLMFAFVMVLFACDGTQTPTTTDQEKVDLVVEEFELSFYPTQVDVDVILPTSIDGVTISWASNKPEVLSGSGELGERSTSNQTITLTATFTLNDVVVKKTFTVVVLAEEVIIEPNGLSYIFEVAFYRLINIHRAHPAILNLNVVCEVSLSVDYCPFNKNYNTHFTVFLFQVFRKLSLSHFISITTSTTRTTPKTMIIPKLICT